MTNFIDTINDSHLAWALAGVLGTIGAHYLDYELNDRCRMLLKTPTVRKLIIFLIAFWVTKDIVASFIATILFIILRRGFLKDSTDDEEN